MKFRVQSPLILAALIGVASGCSEPTEPKGVPAPVYPPKSHAGQDARVPLPANSAVLSGIGTGPSEITSYRWRNVASPGSYSLESPNSRSTKVTNLEQGLYKFELTVKDGGGLTGKDTVSVLVFNPRTVGANELILKDLKWVCPMDCYLSVENFRDYVPDGTPIRVFVGAGGWIEAHPVSEWMINDRFVYATDNGKLLVYANGDVGTVDVKVDF